MYCIKNMSIFKDFDIFLMATKEGQCTDSHFYQQLSKCWFPNTFTKAECYNLFYMFANGMGKKQYLTVGLNWVYLTIKEAEISSYVTSSFVWLFFAFVKHPCLPFIHFSVRVFVFFCWVLSAFYKIRTSAFMLPYMLSILFPSLLFAF